MKEFELFGKNKNIKLFLAPAGDHKGTGMIEMLIQTIKRRLAVFDVDPNWSPVTLANRVESIIKSIRLIPNSTTKMTPFEAFEAHFGRKPNTETSNITTKPSIHNVTYKNLSNKCLDKKITLTVEEIWRKDGNSEDELDIRYKNSGDEMENNESPQVPQASGMVATNQTVLLNSDSDNSENIPLAKNQKNVTPTRKNSKKNSKWTPDKVKKVAIKNQKRQQPIRKATVTPKKGTNWLKKKTSRKRSRTPKKNARRRISTRS